MYYSCCKPFGYPCPYDNLPTDRNITLDMCKACGCLYLKQKSTGDEQSNEIEEEEA